MTLRIEELDIDSFYPESPFDPADLPFPAFMGDANAKFVESFLRHRHFLLRVENGVSRETIAPIKGAIKQIQDRLNGMAENPLSDFSQKRMRTMQDQLNSLLGFGYNQANETLDGRLRQVLDKEHQIISNQFNQILPPTHIPTDLSFPDARAIERMITQPLGGKTWANRMQRAYGESVGVMQGILAEGMALGENPRRTAQKIRKQVGQLSRFRAERIARTEVQRVSNDVAIDIYQRNRDVLKGMRSVETLDGRTCLICANLDGKVWTLDDPRRPRYPIHPMCRGFLSPVTKSIDEMHNEGIIDKAEVPDRLRKSLTGKNPGRINYKTWFNKQGVDFQKDVLGPTKFKLFNAGKLPLEKMVKDLRILPIDELPTDILAIPKPDLTPKTRPAPLSQSVQKKAAPSKL